MILKNKYSKLMQDIVVTSEMEERILKNLSNTPIEDMNKSKKSMFSIGITSKMAMAACLLLLVISGITFLNFNSFSPEPPITIVNPIEDFNTFDALNSALDYNIKQPISLLTNNNQVEYLLIDGYIVEISYIGDNTVIYRMSEGKLDISGDYNDYDNTKALKIGSYEVILKGDEYKYSTVIFSDMKYSYSLFFKKPLPENQVIEIIKSVK